MDESGSSRKVRDGKRRHKGEEEEKERKRGERVVGTSPNTSLFLSPFWFEYCCMSLELPINSC